MIRRNQIIPNLLVANYIITFWSNDFKFAVLVPWFQLNPVIVTWFQIISITQDPITK